MASIVKVRYGCPLCPENKQFCRGILADASWTCHWYIHYLVTTEYTGKISSDNDMNVINEITTNSLIKSSC